MVYGVGVFEDDEVEPAAAAGAARGDAVFVAERLQGLAVLLREGEGGVVSVAGGGQKGGWGGRGRGKVRTFSCSEGKGPPPTRVV